jgi:hypothetical protein
MSSWATFCPDGINLLLGELGAGMIFAPTKAVRATTTTLGFAIHTI